MAVINGTAGADTLTGTDGDDEIKALAGNDVIYGSGGADKIDGGVGVDTVNYSASAEGINVDVRLGAGLAGRGGDAEGDILSNVENVIGTGFNDTFTVGPDARNPGYRFEGGAGDDIYYINSSTTPTIVEQADGGNDEMRVTLVPPSGSVMAANIERLTYIGDKAFRGYGNDSDNIITGGSGNDTLYGGGGADQFIGGAGIDTAGYLDSKAGVTVNLKTGTHTGIATGDTYIEIEAISGSNFADTFVGDGSGIDFDGGSGIDTVDYSTSAAAVNVDVRIGTGAVGIGGDAEGTTLTNIENVIGTAFDDTFTVGPDARNPGYRFEGGAGDDIYYINSSTTPTIVEQADGGNDEMRVTLVPPSGSVMAANIERLTYIGDKAFRGYGNDSDNIITGGSGNDTLYGGGGADQFIGGAGIDTAGYLDSKAGVTVNLKTGTHTGIATGDTYIEIEAISGSNFADTFVGDGSGIDFDGGSGIDTVDYSTSAAAVNVDVRIGTGAVGIGGDAEGTTLTNIENVIGTAFDDTFTVGPDARNPGYRFEGGAGDDIYYINSSTTPTIVEQADGGNDEMRVTLVPPSGSIMAANIERLTYIGDKAFRGYGNDLDNIITGGSGTDTLYGGAGADQFIGGDGYDTVGYLDSTAAMTINLKTGVHSGIGAGDTYTSIEAIGGSNYNDIFYAGSSPMGLDGAGGQDLVTYEQSDSAITIDLAIIAANAGDAAGDTYIGIEIFQGSDFNDRLSGTRLADTFIGGAGADAINGRDGQDSAWYITSDSGVTINLETQVNKGGDAEGDVLLNIERVIGSHFNDTLTGDAATNYLEGGLGNDIIEGGDGNDYLYGGLTSQTGPFTLAGLNNGPQADMLYGGNGNDTIVTAANDYGSQAYGEAGGDVITVVHGMADGGEGNDLLTGTGLDFSLFGGSGNDGLVLKSSGWANGGEGDDIYTVDTPKLVTIQDDGTSNGDKLILSYISGSELRFAQVGDDLYLHRSGFAAGETPQEGVRLKDWYAGYNTIEQIQTADALLITLTGINSEASLMFS